MLQKPVDRKQGNKISHARCVGVFNLIICELIHVEEGGLRFPLSMMQHE